MMIARWKWLSEPLGRTSRSRLELTLGVVVTLAATVGLSTLIRPDPAKLAAKMLLVTPPAGADRDAEPILAPTPAPPPKVPPEFADAVAEGDLAKVDKLYTPHMALDGMLGVAAEAGNAAMTQWLLDHGADVHEDEDNVNAPILLADPHAAVVSLLIARGAAQPSLVTAAQAGAKNAVDRLLAAKAPLDAHDPSALSAAVSSLRADAETKTAIVTALFAAGADPNRDETDSALAGAVHTCEGAGDTAAIDCLPLVKLLVKRGAHARGDAVLAALSLDDSVRDGVLDSVLAARIEPGATAIAIAQAWNPDARALKRVVAKGVDWAWHDGEDDAALPLIAAVQRVNRDQVRALLEGGAPVDARYKDATCALGEAINGATNGPEYARIVEVLLAHGADVNRRLPDGRTPLFAAAEVGDLRIVTDLLDRGARVNELVLDDTALDIAEQSGHTPVARVLHARGGRRARTRSFASGDAP